LLSGIYVLSYDVTGFFFKERGYVRIKIWKCLVGCSDMGCHIDGFISIMAHTHVLQEAPMTGRAADVIAAANTAAEVALRLVKPGRKVIYNAQFLSSLNLVGH
jgi:hypothetical protein